MHRLWGHGHLQPCCQNPLHSPLSVEQFWGLPVLAATTTTPLVGTWVRDGNDPPPPPLGAGGRDGLRPAGKEGATPGTLKLQALFGCFGSGVAHTGGGGR